MNADEGGGHLLCLAWSWVAVCAVKAVGSWTWSWCWTTSGASHVWWDVGRATSAKAVLLWTGAILWGVLGVLEGQTVHVQLISHIGRLCCTVLGMGICGWVRW